MWYEDEEKNNRFFCNFEIIRKMKNCVWKFISKYGGEIIYSRVVMIELRDYYREIRC